jgi:hypothetical protein
LYPQLDLRVKVLLFLPNFDIVDSPLCWLYLFCH